MGYGKITKPLKPHEFESLKHSREIQKIGKQQQSASKAVDQLAENTSKSDENVLDYNQLRKEYMMKNSRGRRAPSESKAPSKSFSQQVEDNAKNYNPQDYNEMMYKRRQLLKEGIGTDIDPLDNPAIAAGLKPQLP